MFTDNPSSPSKINPTSALGNQTDTEKTPTKPSSSTKNFKELLGAESGIPDAADEASVSPTNVFAALVGKEKKEGKTFKSDLGTELVADAGLGKGKDVIKGLTEAGELLPTDVDEVLRDSLGAEPIALNNGDTEELDVKTAPPGHAVAAAMHDKNEQKAINKWDQKTDLENNAVGVGGKELDDEKKVLIGVNRKETDGGENFLGDKKQSTEDFSQVNVVGQVAPNANASTVAFNVPNVGNVDGTSQASLEHRQALANHMQNLINQIVDKAQTLSLNGQTDTTLTLKNLPLFEGATLKLTAFDHASKEFNISFNNLLPQAQKLLATPEAQAALIQSLNEKGYAVHILIVSTQPDNPLTASSANPSENRKEGRQDQEGGQQQGKQQQGRQQQG